MKKLFTLGLALALGIGAYADKLTILTCGLGTPGQDEPDIEGLALSPNGKYVCGAIGYGMGICAVSLETGVVKYFIPEDLEIGGELRHIDNNGLAIGFTDRGILYDYNGGEEGKVIDLPIEITENVRGILGEAITNDGSMLVGSLSSKSFDTEAVYSYDRENWIALPYPTKEELGPYYPKSNGSAAKLVSGDGRIILGFVGNFGLPILWTKNDKGTYDYDVLPEKYVMVTDEDFNTNSKPLWALSAMYLSLSNNGRYASFVGLIPDEDGQPMNVPVIYDIEKKELIIYKEKQAIDEMNLGLYPCSICDDGTFIGTIGKPYFGSVGSFIMQPGQTQAKLFRETFPNYAKLLARADELGYDMPVSLSADGKKILGYTFYSDDYVSEEDPAYYLTYVIDREATDGVEEIIIGEEEAKPAAYYSIDGKRNDKLTPGLNIVLMNDGSTRKVMIK